MGLLGRAIAVAEELAPEWALRRAAPASAASS
jgi:hypothetical protein